MRREGVHSSGQRPRGARSRPSPSSVRSDAPTRAGVADPDPRRRRRVADRVPGRTRRRAAARALGHTQGPNGPAAALALLTVCGCRGDAEAPDDAGCQGRHEARRLVDAPQQLTGRSFRVGAPREDDVRGRERLKMPKARTFPQRLAALPPALTLVGKYRQSARGLSTARSAGSGSSVVPGRGVSGGADVVVAWLGGDCCWEGRSS
jgi:hypothetical protein